MDKEIFKMISEWYQSLPEFQKKAKNKEVESILSLITKDNTSTQFTLSEDTLKSLSRLGYQCIEKGTPFKAKSLFTFLTSLAPNESDLSLALGLSNFHLRNFEEAERHFETAIKINPKNHNALFFLINSHALQNLPKEALDATIQTLST